eukprot:gene3936-biopygen2010
MKVHSLPKSSKLKRGKRKLRQINEAASKKVAAILNVEPDDLEESDEGKEQIEEFIQKASDSDFLINEAASKKVAAILNVEPDDLEESDEGKEQIEEFIQKASDSDFLR